MIEVNRAPFPKDCPRTGAVIDGLCPYEDTKATKALEAHACALERELNEVRITLLAGFPILGKCDQNDVQAVALAAVDFDTRLRSRPLLGGCNGSKS